MKCKIYKNYINKLSIIIEQSCARIHYSITKVIIPYNILCDFFIYLSYDNPGHL